jgi:hypothetical protein
MYTQFLVIPLITAVGNLRKCQLPAQTSGKGTLFPFIARAAILAHSAFEIFFNILFHQTSVTLY